MLRWNLAEGVIAVWRDELAHGHFKELQRRRSKVVLKKKCKVVLTSFVFHQNPRPQALNPELYTLNLKSEKQ